MSLQGNKVLGIRREDKNKWERRAPLAPEHVKELTNKGIRVLIQPSTRRVFPDNLYAKAGGVITEDLTPASTILAVKEVPAEVLIPERTYVFFSHTIKAQKENMHLLDTILEKRVRLIDYECITETGERQGRRLVAFGRYAGIAGAIDYMRGLGERLLALGFSTPFLNVGSAYMYPTLDAAFEAIRRVGESIQQDVLPRQYAPFIVGFTGRGNVSKGAQEVFKLLPHEVITPQQLPEIMQGVPRTDIVYIVEIGADAMVRRRGASEPRSPDELHLSEQIETTDKGFSVGEEDTNCESSSSADDFDGIPLYSLDNSKYFDSNFDRDHYREHPELYESIFHKAVAPYLSVLVNCMYWDSKYPRLLTVKQAQKLHQWRSLRMVGVCDISCDQGGSVEFLREFTSIEKPFYIYDPMNDEAVHDDMEAPGLLFHAVDHLPSEVPSDASRHFGNCLLPFLPALVESNGAAPYEEQSKDMPKELYGAVITSNGELTPSFDYIAQLRASASRAAAGRQMKRARGGLGKFHESFTSLTLKGHLFDTGVINKLLDLIEESPVSANITDINVGKDRTTLTAVQFSLFSPNAEALQRVLVSIRDVATSLNTAISVSSSGGLSTNTTVALEHKPSKHVGLPSGQRRILLLGAGFVTPPLVKFLLRRERNFITVASMFEHEAKSLCSRFPRCAPTVLNVSAEEHFEKMHALVANHDVIISLVPAPLHPKVAEAAIAHKRHMVTASYVSPAMQDLNTRAKDAGVCILNEVGLDPGIDHMSAMAMLDAARGDDCEILSFSSVCGGLPAPEAANNALGYKFSWSPRGVLTATQNPAKWMRGGQECDVPGEHLLASAQPFDLHANPAFRLECLPNRNCISYREKYGIPDVPNMFRGTLRYAGFSIIMYALSTLGLMSQEAAPELQDQTHSMSMREWIAHRAGVADSSKCSDSEILEAIYAKTEAARADAASKKVFAGDDVPLTPAQRKAIKTGIHGLGLFSSDTVPVTQTAAPIDTFTQILSNRADMSYAKGERDMALMQHEVIGRQKNGQLRRYVSTLCEYANANATAMARTVGITAAIATQLILDGEAGSRIPGVTTPVARHWYDSIMEALAKEGIEMREQCEDISEEEAQVLLAKLTGKC